MCEVAVWDVDLDGEVGDVLDARVVRVGDERLHRHDRVHRRDEPAVPKPHGI